MGHREKSKKSGVGDQGSGAEDRGHQKLIADSSQLKGKTKGDLGLIEDFKKSEGRGQRVTRH
jgi:hypothetical protein